MNIRPVISILMIFLLLQSSFGGLYATGVFLNNSSVAHENIALPDNTSINIGGNASVDVINTANTNHSNFESYPLNCPKWDNYKDKHQCPITNFMDYRDDLQGYVKEYTSVDNNNLQYSKASYENKSGYFSGNPIYDEDMDYRYMTTSELNQAYGCASIAKSRILLPNSLSSTLQATYTMAAYILSAASGVCGILTAVAAVTTGASAGTFTPLLIVCITITSAVTACTIAIGTCATLINYACTDINVDQGKIDSRLILMNSELIYRSNLPQQNLNATTSFTNKTNNTLNSSRNNKTLNNNTTPVNNTTNIKINTILNNIITFTNKTGLKNTLAMNNSTALNNKTVNTNNATNTTNSTNTTELDGNVYGVNDVPPSQESMPSKVTLNRSGTYMDGIYDIDMSNFPEKPTEPHPKWWQFWVWVEYGAKYLGWSFEVMGWGFNHLNSLNSLVDICGHIISDSKS
jgi:hypothetical protein